MAARKGHNKIGGREIGTHNKFTSVVKETFEFVFSELQNDPKSKLSEWAKKNTTDFYKLVAKLIPVQMNAVVKTDCDISLNFSRPDELNAE